MWYFPTLYVYNCKNIVSFSLSNSNASERFFDGRIKGIQTSEIRWPYANGIEPPNPVRLTLQHGDGFVESWVSKMTLRKRFTGERSHVFSRKKRATWRLPEVVEGVPASRPSVRAPIAYAVSSDPVAGTDLAVGPGRHELEMRAPIAFGIFSRDRWNPQVRRHLVSERRGYDIIRTPDADRRVHGIIDTDTMDFVDGELARGSGVESWWEYAYRHEHWVRESYATAVAISVGAATASAEMALSDEYTATIPVQLENGCGSSVTLNID